jgi:hypothetical protein
MAMNYTMNAMKEARAAGIPMTGSFAERNGTVHDRLSVDGKPVAHELCYDHQGSTVRLAVLSHGDVPSVTLNGIEVCTDIEIGSTVRLGYWLHATHYESGDYVVQSSRTYMNSAGGQCACVVFVRALRQGMVEGEGHPIP